MSFKEHLKKEMQVDLSLFDIGWLIVALAAQFWAYASDPDSTLLAMVSGISGLLCVFLVSKGKIINYLFGLIFAYTYFYVAWKSNFLGEMNTVLYVYLPAQFIGYFMWKEHMREGKKGENVAAKVLTPKGWAVLIISGTIGTLLFIEALKVAGGSSTGLDGLTTIITVAGQLLMILRYREQWLLWIGLNVFSVFLWKDVPAMLLMYSAYLVNSIYGYYNWTKLAKQAQN